MKTHTRIIFHSLGALALAVGPPGCTSSGGGRRTTLPEPRPLGHEYADIGHRLEQDDAGAGVDPSGDSTDRASPLTLKRALELALMRSPELTGYAIETRAADARARQAQLAPNPELSIDFAEVGRGGRGWDATEASVTLGRLIELGGKRRARRRVAETERELAGWDYESARLDVCTTTTLRFLRVLRAQQAVVLEEAAVAVAAKTAKAVQERVAAGKAPPFQAETADAGLESARLQVVAASNELAASRVSLAAVWRASDDAFGEAVGALDSIGDEVPSLDALRPLLGRNPSVARFAAEQVRLEGALEAARAAAVPDVTVAAGYQHFEEDRTDAWTFGVGWPLPLIDRNQGAISAAALALDRSRADRRGAELALEAELADVHAAMVTARQRAVGLQTRIVPAIQSAFDAAQQGYLLGKHGYLEMADAQRGLFDAQRDLLAAWSEYHAAVARIERLTATPFAARGTRRALPDSITTTTPEDAR